ncbi:probable G-protein coupled receptor 101 [Mercenaria mercenaria]|uniref:probable G-protein coupled receptor 101 n=1 Tax=Mercenaria mercenaria TaxID=6596 RepID=UPI00234EC0AD|nr:probable G-protein coupled receptor 101 [Mercenaria mercenaria]
MARMNTSWTGKDLSNAFTMDVLPVTVFISIEAFIGFFGNITILLVYSRRYRRINFRYFVLALAIVDLTSCCTTLPGEVISQLNWYDYQYAWICKVKTFFNIYTALSSASVLLVLAIDRYRKICHPLNFDWQIRCHVALRLCRCCLIVSALVSIPALILYGKQTNSFEHEGNNITVTVCEIAGEYAGTIYPLLYIGSIYLVAMTLMILADVSLNLITAWRLFGYHSMKTANIKHDTKKAVVAITLTSETSNDGIDNDRETKATTSKISGKKEDHGAENAKNANSNFYMSAKRQSNQSSKFKRKSADEGYIDDDDKTSEISSTDYLSNDEEFIDDNNSGNEQIGNSSTDQTSSEQGRRTSLRSRRSNTKTSKFQLKSKTMIMLILTAIFAATMILYIILTGLVVKPDGILRGLPESQLVPFFFFWRLYFVNSVVNPILYGFMDPGFRSGFMSYMRRNKHSVTSST